MNFININLEGIFKFCCVPFKRKKKKDDLTDFTQSLRNHPIETKISMILQKLCNGRNDLVLIYQVNDNNFSLINHYGNLNNNKVNLLNCLVIPIFINSSLKYILTICKKSKKYIDIDDNLLNLLKDVLH